VRLAVAVERDRLRPGERVAGHVEVREGGDGRRLTARLRLLEVTRDHRVPVVTVELGTLAEGELRAGEGHIFEGRVPEDALPSHRAPNSALLWCVEAHVDRRGSDVIEWAEVVVLPPAANEASAG
jgi:hypothetical protein